MGVLIRVSLYSRKVVKVIERYLPTSKQAREYLETYNIPPTTKGTHFKVGGDDFGLSHPYEDILKHDDLPDNNWVRAMRPRETRIIMPTPKAEDVTPTAGSRKPLNGSTICLKEICREIDMEPRQARAILRRKFPDNGKQRWEWDAKEAEQVRAVLQSAK